MVVETLSSAGARRLRRNYVWMFLILLLAWILKISSPQLGNLVTSVQEAIDNASVGPIPGLLMVTAIAVFYAYLGYTYFRPFDEAGYGEVHV